MSKIQVIGESCLDLFVYCDALRLAPDLPVPILHELRVETNPGMAANVHRNILTKIQECTLHTNPNWENLTKTRYVHEISNHLFFRVDKFESVEPIELSTIRLDSDLVVISDYNKGFLSESVIEYICESHDRVFLDTKKILGSWAEKALFIKINDFEFKNSIPFISEKLKHKLIHTRGAMGCDFNEVNYPVERVQVSDSSGAGDSFMAALVIEFLKAEDIISSIKHANLAASRVVKSRGVGVI